MDSKDIEILHAASTSRRDTFLPWRGIVGRCRKLCLSGHLQGAGISVSWPHQLYIITEKGRRALHGTEEG